MSEPIGGSGFPKTYCSISRTSRNTVPLRSSVMNTDPSAAMRKSTGAPCGCAAGIGVSEVAAVFTGLRAPQSEINSTGLPNGRPRFGYQAPTSATIKSPFGSNSMRRGNCKPCATTPTHQPAGVVTLLRCYVDTRQATGVAGGKVRVVCRNCCARQRKSKKSVRSPRCRLCHLRRREGRTNCIFRGEYVYRLWWEPVS